MNDYFSVSDFFVVGIGFDLVGAYLVARGLLASPSTLALRAGTFLGSNPNFVVDGVKDRTDAIFGVSFLGLGFSLQAVGYFLDLGFAPGNEASVARAAVAVVLMLLTMAAALGLWRSLKDQLIARTLIEASRWTVTNASKPAERGEISVGDLALFGASWRGDLGEDENYNTYVARVFGIEVAARDRLSG